MSNGPPDHTQDDVASPHDRRLSLAARRAGEALGEPVRALAFWSAVLLPLAYVPLLLFGLDTRRRAAAFSLLLLVHFVALVVGRSYRSE